MQKTSIRFFEDIPVRAVWDEESSKWWFCAADITEALTKSKNPRSYWNKIKSRKNELSTICRQLKLKARDGKFYNTDVVDEAGLNVCAVAERALRRQRDVAVYRRARCAQRAKGAPCILLRRADV